MKFNKLIMGLSVSVCVASLCVVLAACSTSGEDGQLSATGDSSSAASSEDPALEDLIANASPDDPYVADEVCLSCHGGTYEAVAELTDEYGDSNPHAGAHGNGTMSCGSCHTDGKSKPTDENNYCLNCHNWPREEQAYVEYMDL